MAAKISGRGCKGGGKNFVVISVIFEMDDPYFNIHCETLNGCDEDEFKGVAKT